METKECLQATLEAERDKAQRAAATADSDLQIRRAQGEYAAYTKLLRIVTSDT